MMEHLRDRLSGLPETARGAAEELVSARDALAARIDSIRGMTPSGRQSRIHGDFHLGQVLVVHNDVLIIDYEGEPARTLEEREAKTSPLRDVAGMLRSFDYALWTALDRRIQKGGDAERAADMVENWREATQETFLTAYRDRLGGDPIRPTDPAFEATLLDLFLIQKAAYEVDYELAMRPNWVGIPK